MRTTAGVRYCIVPSLPEQVRTPEFVDLADNQVRLRLLIRDGELTIIATGADVARCEQMLVGLGATELGVELCG